MFSFFQKLLHLLLLLLVIAFLLRNDAPKWLFERWIHNTTDQTLTIEALSFSSYQPALIKGYDFALENPFRFPAGNALKGSRFEVLFPRTFWYGFNFQIERLTLQIAEVNFVRDESGQLNLVVRREKGKSPAPDAVPLIRDLILSIDRVSYTDNSANGSKETIAAAANLKELHVHDVADLRQLEEIIVREAKTRTHLAGLEKN